jgi:hypothetical protein
MKYFLEKLKHITLECGTHPVFVLTPLAAVCAAAML